MPLTPSPQSSLSSHMPVHTIVILHTSTRCTLTFLHLPWSNPFPSSPSHLTFPAHLLTCFPFPLISPVVYYRLVSMSTLPDCYSCLFASGLCSLVYLLPETWNLRLITCLFWTSFLDLDLFACFDWLLSFDSCLPHVSVRFSTLIWSINPWVCLLCLHLGPYPASLRSPPWQITNVFWTYWP